MDDAELCFMPAFEAARRIRAKELSPVELMTAVLVAMHDLTLAAQYCDRLIMLFEGRGFAVGTPSEVLTAANIEAVYGAEVYLVPHPLGGTPVVLPARGARRENYR